MSLSYRRTALSAALLFALHSISYAATPVPASVPGVDALDRATREPGALLLRSGIFDPVSQSLDLRSTGAADVTTSNYAIVQFTAGRMDAAKHLKTSGAEVVGYIPNNAYLVRLNGVSLDQARGTAGVRWAGSWQPGMKIDPRLWSAELGALRPDASGGVELEISAFAGENVDAIAAALSKVIPAVQFTNRLERADAPRLRVRVARHEVATLIDAAARVDGVAWIERYVKPKTSNAGAVAAIQGNATAALSGSGAVGAPLPMWDHNLFGSGQIVAVADSGLDRNEAFFTTLNKGSGPVVAITDANNSMPPTGGPIYPDRKVYAYWVQPGATAYDEGVFHGTHVSGTVLGDAAGTFNATTYVASTPTAANHELADGMAPNAQLLFQDIGSADGLTGLNDVRATLEQAYYGGARLHSDSWGAPTFGEYSSNDNDVDYQSWMLPDNLVIIAAGNEGDLTLEPDFQGNVCPTPLFINGICTQSVGSPGNAKNGLTVGALGHAGSTTVAGYSSRGLTADGRIKPDIMAPGSSTISAAGDTNNGAAAEAPATKGMSGTSMATPTIAGNAALVRQYFMEGFYPRGVKTAADAYNPSGMAMKAILLNGTNAIQGSEFGKATYGWGRAWLDSNLWFANTLGNGNDARRLRLFERTTATGLKTGQTDTYTISAVAAGQELRATLTWFDPEAASGVAATLVNNLNLEVVGPDSTVYRGNVFNAGVSVSGGTADAKNTVEQVRFTAPAAGAYTFRVIGAAVPGNGRTLTDSQGYALAVSGAFGLPNVTPAYAAPTLLEASNTATAVQVEFAAPAGAQSFQLYRADGGCTNAAPGDFRLVAHGASSPLVDDRTQGGFAYAYKVRGVSGDVEGDVSECVDVVSTDTCTLVPTFNQSTITANANSASCRVRLDWIAAQTGCPTSSGMKYDIFRSTSPEFTSPVQVATATPNTQFDDTTVENGRPYYYRVIAKDSFGNASPTARTLQATPAGANGPDPLTFLDDVDTHAYMTLQQPWRITATSSTTPTHSYATAADGANYTASTCGGIETPALTIPAGARLTFKARYNLETNWDGVVMEYSTDGGTTWTDLPPDGGYPSDFSETGSPPVNACSYAASHGAFSGKTTASSNNAANNAAGAAVFKPFSRDLASLAGQTVKIRWRSSSDPATEFEGFFLDEVRIGNVDILFKDGLEPNAYMCH
ncbi:S8 family serine peptidase [Tahibacter amnicola]|uniref:S8 family serine peptidase n=1 Tax=Tahibacter amnicola TaxID=2976241 RepID=A0ABY6BEE2_9GAMM|nr:S8 family serine peptidase [Tahibacter amnicola]UXI67618.1 S8 family serine peptidase [Tahibacter amnicola]